MSRGEARTQRQYAALAAAQASLRGRDPVLDRLVAEHGRARLPRAMPVARRFGSVAESIAYQQLHGKAAASIWGRVLRLVGDPVTPDGVLAVSVGELRGCGLSGSKVVSLMELSEATLAGTVPFQRFGRMDDAAVIAALSSVRGIGPWTAQMFLMFSLARLDVWPTGDFGVASGFAAAWGLPERPTPKQLADLGAPFAGVRSLVAWYCWRATETA